MNKPKKENLMVIVIDKNKKPLSFMSEKRAQQMLNEGRATIHMLFPFIIRMKDIDVRDCETHEFKIKVDPGSKYTGIAITDLNNNVYFKANLEHRGQAVVSGLEKRKGNRRDRRNRKTGYRRCKFKKNQKVQTNRPEGWLPPSIISIENNIINFIKKIMKYINIVECVIEDVSLDMQKLENPNIKNWEYQHGTLEGITIKEYLHNKYGYTCQYCNGASGDKQIEIEHKNSKANNGSNKIDNLTLACHTCNQAKGKLNLVDWYEKLKISNKKLDQVRVPYVEKAIKDQPIKAKNYGAWVNSYHKKLIEDINMFEFQNVELSDGITTAYNRKKHNIQKEHYNDAICIGNIPETFKDYTTVVYKIKATGRGNRIKGKPNECGILNKNNIAKHKVYQDPETKEFFQTGDICKIEIPKGKYKGSYVARISIRHTGKFDFKDKNKNRITTDCKNCTVIQKANGYNYEMVHSI